MQRTLSPEGLQAIRKARLEQALSNYDWSIAEPYLDVQLNQSSRNRKLSFITLREFKSQVTNSVGLKEIAKQGVCKHVLQFFSNFCQNKIKLTKESFEAEYNDGRSLEEIAKAHNISREDITFLRQLYGIKTKGSTFQQRKQNETPLTQTQREIICGSLMGDGKKVSDSAVGFGHGDDQKEYLFWKYAQLEDHASKESLKPYHYTDKRNGYKGIKWSFYTYANTEIESIVKMFYKGEKDVTQQILDELTPLSVAVWYMDDGLTKWQKKYREQYPHRNFTPECHFCTDSFSREACELMTEWFENKYGIKTHIRQNGCSKQGKPRFRIIVDTPSVDKFFLLISPHIIPSMRYKVDYNAYLKKLGR
jgi:hypothetical protein